MRNYKQIAVQIGSVLLPCQDIDPKKWAVIACDQFTSQPEYWQQVDQLVGSNPSTFHLILPEVYLGKPEEKQRLNTIRANMIRYQEENLFVSYEGMLLVERTYGKHTRHGLIVALDLEQYDYTPGSQSLIRATEGTILDRLPPRIRIREGALLEIPHILVLIDDPEKSVIEPLVDQTKNQKTDYQFELMLGSGTLTGRFIQDISMEKRCIQALEVLANPAAFRQKYRVDKNKGVLLFAVGDGNHSLATAKAIWEKTRGKVAPDHPSRYAMVELVNVHDPGLAFEPIHRVLFDVKANILAALSDHFISAKTIRCNSMADMVQIVDAQGGPHHSIGVIQADSYTIIEIYDPSSNLPVGTLQDFLDQWLLKSGGQIDYVHGLDTLEELGAKKGNIGFYLPAMKKADLFSTVILDGVLPRKTFSMGEAKEKRFYMECRRIIE
jgi:hypothetical protein